MAQELCTTHRLPADVSTAILFTEIGGRGKSSTIQVEDKQQRNMQGQGSRIAAYIESDSILVMFTYLKFPYRIIGYLALYLVPQKIRDIAYRIFAKNRGAIWKALKKVTGIGDTFMYEHKDSILGLDDDDTFILESWGFHRPCE